MHFKTGSIDVVWLQMSVKVSHRPGVIDSNGSDNNNGDDNDGDNDDDSDDGVDGIKKS